MIDPLGRNVMIQEYTSSSLTSTRQFVWANGFRREARDGSSSVTAQYFLGGEIVSGTNYLLAGTGDSSVREVTNSSGTVVQEYSYDPFGRLIDLYGSANADLQFASYYSHGRSGLSLTGTRAYSAQFGRFVNRDPIDENGGVNLFAYTSNMPTESIDPSGTSPAPWGNGKRCGDDPKKQWGYTPPYFPPDSFDLGDDEDDPYITVDVCTSPAFPTAFGLASFGGGGGGSAILEGGEAGSFFGPEGTLLGVAGTAGVIGILWMAQHGKNQVGQTVDTRHPYYTQYARAKGKSSNDRCCRLNAEIDDAAKAGDQELVQFLQQFLKAWGCKRNRTKQAP
jgi:RHS repeat-associated protein